MTENMLNDLKAIRCSSRIIGFDQIEFSSTAQILFTMLSSLP